MFENSELQIFGYLLLIYYNEFLYTKLNINSSLHILNHLNQFHHQLSDHVSSEPYVSDF